MATHPRDHSADNPRIQCIVCAKWMRLHQSTARNTPSGEHTQNFFGGCQYALDLTQAGLHRGEEHLAGKDGDHDVCETCCHVACKAIHDERRLSLTEQGEKP